MQSIRGQLNNQELNTILNIVLHGGAGVGLTLISEVFLKLNYGIYAPYISLVLSVITGALTQYLKGASAKDIQIQSLEQAVKELQSKTTPAV